jgi:HEAT repeat protein
MRRIAPAGLLLAIAAASAVAQSVAGAPGQAPAGAAAPAALAKHIEDLQNVDWEVRVKALEAIAALGPAAASAVPALKEAVADGTTMVRCIACNALGAIGAGARPAMAALREALEDEILDVRYDAWAAIGKIDPPPAGTAKQLAVDLAAKRLGDRWQAARRLEELGPKAGDVLPELIKAVNDVDWGVCIAAIDAIGAVGAAAKDAVEPVALAAEYHKIDVQYRRVRIRSRAAVALGRIGPAAIPALLKLMDHPTSAPRIAAVEAMNAMDANAAPCVDVLAKALEDYEIRVRAVAAESLPKLGATGAASLAKAAAHEHGYVRKLAAEAMGRVGRDAAEAVVPALTKLLADESEEVRCIAAMSLGRHGPAAKPALPALEKLSTDPTAWVASAARKAIAQTQK